MTLRDQLIADNAIFLNADEFAEGITYNGKPILAVVAIGDSALRGDTFEKQGLVAVGTVNVSTLDVPEPETGDSIVYNDIIWTVARILETDFAMHKLQIITGESAFPL